jgi:hypothetical protein
VVAGMAAVMCFVFLFALASVGLLFKSFLDGSLGSTLALLTFIAMAAGIFVGMFKMAKRWESEAGPEH